VGFIAGSVTAAAAAAQPLFRAFACCQGRAPFASVAAAMAKLPLSVCMISGAEAGRIGRALQSVTDRVGEVIVVLNEDVRDGTDALCEAQGAKVYREPWKGFVGQKNSAAAKASSPWILSLDADEEVSPALWAEIAAVLEAPDRKPTASNSDRSTLARSLGGDSWLLVSLSGDLTSVNLAAASYDLLTGQTVFAFQMPLTSDRSAEVQG